MKKILSIILCFTILATLFTGCAKSSGGKAPAAGGTLKVALAADTGGINDKSINEDTHAGMKRAAKDFGVTYKVIEARRQDDYESNLEALVSDGNKLIIGIGGNMANTLEKVAKRHPDVNFAILDTAVKADNVRSLVFKEQEGSFLVGVVAGLMTKTNKVGFIGGMDIDVISRFESGFAAGVMSVNPEAGAGLIGANGASGKMVKFADSFSDSNKGYELAKSLYASGCDVIYHAAGPVGIGLFKAAKDVSSATGHKVWAIGVDQDQAAALPEYADYILTSMVKRAGNAAYQTVKLQKEGKFKGGVISLGLAEDGMALAQTTDKNTPKDVIEVAKKAADMIKSGQIKVPATRAELATFKPVKLK